MARTTPNAPTSTVEPRTELLRHGLGRTPPEPYYIEEEEVPRSGIEVTRRFQRARWYDGRVHLWIGRHKKAGRGESHSLLRFDQVVPTNTPSDR